MEAEYYEIGRRIRALRAGKAVSQGELAGRMGISQTGLSNIERGRTRATLKNLFKIRDLLGCSMRDFFEDRSGGNLSQEEITEALRIMKKIKTAEAEEE